jgi:hypothetical protein
LRKGKMFFKDLFSGIRVVGIVSAMMSLKTHYFNRTDRG